MMVLHEIAEQGDILFLAVLPRVDETNAAVVVVRFYHPKALRNEASLDLIPRTARAAPPNRFSLMMKEQKDIYCCVPNDAMVTTPSFCAFAR